MANLTRWLGLAARRQAVRPMAAVAVALTLGIAAAGFCPAYHFAGIASATALLLGAAALALYRQRLTLAWSAGIMAIAACGLLLALAQRDAFADHDVRALLASGSFTLDEPLAFAGCVIEESEERETDSVTTIELRATRQRQLWRPVRGRGILSVGLPQVENVAAPRLRRGDLVRGWALWRRPRNYENPGSEDRVARLQRRGVFILGRTKSYQLLEIMPGACAGPVDHLANAVRAQVRAALASGASGGPNAAGATNQRAAILASLIVGDYSGLRNETREAFQNTGAFHVLVVSGLHVAWIAGVLFLLLKTLRTPERAARLLTALAVLAYTCVVGFQASITRCLWIFLLFLLGRLLFRRADALNLLFAVALILLSYNPDWLYETGFQLSFLSVAAIMFLAAPVIDNVIRPLTEPLRQCGRERVFTARGVWTRIGRRVNTHCELWAEALADRLTPALYPVLCWIGRRAGALALAVAGMVAASVAVQLWIEPLLAHQFNRLSWIAPLANIVMVPLSSLTLAAGIAGTLAAWAGGTALIEIAEVLAGLLLGTAQILERWPGAWQRCPTPPAIYVLTGIVLLLLWGLCRLRRRWLPCLYVVALLAITAYGGEPFASFFRPAEPLRIINGAPGAAKRSELEKTKILSLTFLDVGQGDAIVVKLPDGGVRTIDAGGMQTFQAESERAAGFDIGEAVVSRYLWRQWRTTLDRVTVSHTDADHAGGVPALLRNFTVGAFAYAAAGQNPVVLERLRCLARERHIGERKIFAGMREQDGPVSIRALHPPVNSTLASANANSLALRLTYGRFSALLTGDLEKTGEAELLSTHEKLSASLLKVAHHGSRTATSHAFLERVRPRWAIIQAGRHNPYRHPAPATLARLRQHGVQTLTTMDYGAITFATDGTRYILSTYRGGILKEGELEK